MAERNRILVGLPERLRKSNAALGEAERKLQVVTKLYSQRLVLKDSVVLDQIGEVLNLPRIDGDHDAR